MQLFCVIRNKYGLITRRYCTTWISREEPWLEGTGWYEEGGTMARVGLKPTETLYLPHSALIVTDCRRKRKTQATRDGPTNFELRSAIRPVLEAF